jgi:hypothetical protein
LLVAYIVTTGCAFPISPPYPNKFEWSYDSIATDLSTADLCYKISPDVMTNGKIFFGFSYFRSRCFHTIAQDTLNIDLCDNVIGLSPLYIFNEDHHTKKKCIEDVKAGRKANVMSHSNGDYELIMKLLGYYDEELIVLVMPENHEKKKFIAWEFFFNLYNKERSKLEFRKKLLELPDFSSSDKKALKQIHKLAPQCNSDDNIKPLCNLINNSLCRDFRGCVSSTK